MPKIKQRSDGRYQKGFRFNGKQYTVIGRTLKEVEEKKLRKIEELEKGEKERENPTLNNYYEFFTDCRKNSVKPSTLRNQGHAFRNCAKIVVNKNGTTLGELHIRDIKSKDVKVIQKGMLNSGLSPRTVNDYCSHLSHVFNQAIKDELINRNPCVALVRLQEPKKKPEEDSHRGLSLEETALFFEYASNSYYINAFKLLIQTGMRIGELTALKYTDIDLKENCIHIHRTVTRTSNGVYYISETTKTKSSTRDFPLNSKILKIIQDQKRLNEEVFGKVRDFDNLLFKNPSGDFIKDYTIDRELKRICKKANMNHFSCHAFRHTFATRFMEQRPQDFKILSELLGHSSVKITLNLYTHVSKENKVKAVQGIQIAM